MKKSSSLLFKLLLLIFALSACSGDEPKTVVIYQDVAVTRIVEHNEPVQQVVVNTDATVSDSAVLTQTYNIDMPPLDLSPQPQTSGGQHGPLPREYSWYRGLCEYPLRPPEQLGWDMPSGVFAIVLCTHRLAVNYDDWDGGRTWVSYEQYDASEDVVTKQVAFAEVGTRIDYDAVHTLKEDSFWPQDGIRYLIIREGKDNSLDGVAGWSYERVFTWDGLVDVGDTEAPIYIYQYVPQGGN